MLDDALRDYDLQWHVVCEFCKLSGNPEPFARPTKNADGVVELVCGHARRMADR